MDTNLRFKFGIKYVRNCRESRCDTDLDRAIENASRSVSKHILEWRHADPDGSSLVAMNVVRPFLKSGEFTAQLACRRLRKPPTSRRRVSNDLDREEETY